jgi:hypothetical protein
VGPLFRQHCPVPTEVTASLNLDMISGNGPNAIYLGSCRSPPARQEHPWGKRPVVDEMKYTTGALRDGSAGRSVSLQPLAPGVWFFSGTTPDYHANGTIRQDSQMGR